MSSIACCPAEVRSAAPQGAGRGAVYQQQPGRSARLCPSPSRSSIVQTAGNVRQQLRRQLLEELHHHAAQALQLSLIQEIIQQKASCRALYSTLASNHAPPELYSLYSVVYYTAIQLIQYTALYNHPLGAQGSTSLHTISPPASAPASNTYGMRPNVTLRAPSAEFIRSSCQRSPAPAPQLNRSPHKGSCTECHSKSRHPHTTHTDHWSGP